MILVLKWSRVFLLHFWRINFIFLEKDGESSRRFTHALSELYVNSRKKKLFKFPNIKRSQKLVLKRKHTRVNILENDYLLVSFMGCYSKDCPGNDRERVKEACFYIEKHYHIDL